MAEKQRPRRASTVILLRRGEREGFEIFLTRRPEGMAFLGGMYCFPGGTVREEDSSPELLRRCYGLTPAAARKVLGSRFAPGEALSFWIAAIRELFEETGVLLAADAATLGQRLHPSQPDLASTIGRYERKKDDANVASFQTVLETRNLVCDLSRLHYLSHWQTPSEQPIRFDTRFFLTLLPEHQSPLSSSPEVTHSVWVTPDEALKRFENNELPMIFPTFASIRRLGDFDSLEALLSERGMPDSSSR
ncbi:MAG TPA: NUDIX domain-containing protein [Candidatus Binatia bacterium]|jgi:8-oxo-dGTP pyrophosphatase MutT (NUDIX family)